MLARTLVFASVVAVSATQLPSVMQMVIANPPEPEASVASVEARPQQKPNSPTPVAFSSGSIVLAADARGHFTGNFRMNGRPVDGLIDTGASTIAINEDTARRLGYSIAALDFRYQVNTANGVTKAAHVVLDHVEIGSIRVQKVDAFVLRDKALSGTLVGMSFLKKLRSFSVESGQLRLVQ